MQMYLVVYIGNNNQVGNVDCDFINDPPTIYDIRNAEKSISNKFCNGNKAVIVNWLKIADKEN